MSESRDDFSFIVSILEYYKDRILDFKEDEELNFDVIEEGIDALLEKIDAAIKGITENNNAQTVKFHQQMVSLALKSYLKDSQEHEEEFIEDFGEVEIFSNKMQEKRDKIKSLLKNYYS